MDILKIFPKILRRLQKFASEFKHYCINYFEIQPCWCRGKHDEKLFAEFAPKLAGVFAFLKVQGLLPQWVLFPRKSVNLNDKILQGNLWLFDHQFLPFGNNASWLCTCEGKACKQRCKHFIQGQFYAHALKTWAKNNAQPPCLGQDLRLIWEKSRLQFLAPLLLPCKLNPNEKISEFIQQVLTDWQEQNYFLQGPNWTCAMEAAIRAINLLWALSNVDFAAQFKHVWVKQLCLHAYFIDDALEKFDRPNNHILADYLGLLYLAAFFNKKPLAQRYATLFDAEILRQINYDGSSYEGSVQYHLLVSEFFAHRLALGHVLQLLPPEEQILKTWEKMREFAQHNAGVSNVGDNDSAKLIFGWPKNMSTTVQTRLFKNFGSWIKHSPDFSIVLHARQKNPQAASGHFHQDCLSLQLNFNDQPLLIDPGSGFYSSNSKLRNFMRSFAAHTTFCPVESLGEVKKMSPFYFAQTCVNEVLEFAQDFVSMRCKNKDYETTRSVAVKDREIIVTDVFVCEAPQKVCWQWVLAPQVTVKKMVDGQWLLHAAGGKVLLHSSITLFLKRNFYAKHYANVVVTQALRGVQTCNERLTVTTKLQLD